MVENLPHLKIWMCTKYWYSKLKTTLLPVVYLYIADMIIIMYVCNKNPIAHHQTQAIKGGLFTLLHFDTLFINH